MTRAVRRRRDGLGVDPKWLFADVQEPLVKSKRVKDGSLVLRCEDNWPSGMLCTHDEVELGDKNRKMRYGRTGLIWGNIAPRFRESTLDEFMPIVWWFREQRSVWHASAGPYVAWPRRIGDAATTWQRW